MDILRLKSYFPIYKAGDKLCVGINGTNRFVENDYSVKNNVDVQNLLELKYTEAEVKEIPMLNELFRKEMLEPATNVLRTRNELFFQYLDIPFLPPHILRSNILIFGAGAAGATLALLLAQFGFLNLIVVDDDIVEVSDVEKTVVYRHEDIGTSKVIALARILQKNYGAAVRIFEECPSSEIALSKIIEASQASLVIKACDPDLNFRVILNKICFDAQIPHLHLSYAFERINLGPFYIPGTTCCDNSFNTHVKTSYGEHNDFSNHQKLFTHYTIHPSISFNINILASLALKEIVFFFAQKHEYVLSINQIVFFHPLTMQGAAIQLKCCETCPYAVSNSIISSRH